MAKKTEKTKSYNTVGLSTKVKLAYDPPLTASEIARVKESRQNIREGKYTDFAAVDDVWKFAESD
jgi:hypothetical protein